MEGHITIGMLIAFQGLVLQFTGPVSGLFGLMDRVQRLRGDVQRLDDVLDYPVDPLVEKVPLYTRGDAQATPAAAKLAGEIELRDVTFGYNPNEEPLLTGFSLHATPGERIGIVGPSGCGKSTVAKLVMGLYPPNSGEILFDGQAREAYTRYALANSVALVDQDIALFEGSFRDNITMWDPGLSEQDIIQAAKDALIHDFIMSRAGGYDAPVAEGGRNMSGGQKQRLELARALATHPRVLVLDEATSALDSATEEQIEHNLRRRGCTCIVIAHRLSTIRECERIILLVGGRIVEQGSHDELLSIDNGVYRSLVLHE
jgi:ABC-type bacteriocin/lantibiotic exporter with double-glycine peptidase domain